MICRSHATTRVLLAVPLLIAAALSCAPVAGAPPEPPAAPQPLPSLDHRRDLLSQRNAAAAASDLTAEATLNGELAGDALRRAMAVHNAWMARRDPTTGLFPQSLARQEFNYRNTAADFFCFQLGIAMSTGAVTTPALKETLAKERSFNTKGELCQALDWKTGKQIQRPLNDRMFSTAEYMKDGLVSLYDRTGDPDVLARMIELGDAIVSSCREQSNYGMIPSRDSEVNGDVLQALSRLAFTTGDPKYADLVGRLTDAAVEQMLKHSGGLPTKRYNYIEDSTTRTVVQLRDHGNETAVGLSEAFALAVAKQDDHAWRERADRWVDPLARMYEIILKGGVNADGLLVNQIDAKTYEIRDPAPCDNWGYLLSGAILFTEAAARQKVLPQSRLDAILARVDAIALAVTKTDGVPWEGQHHDGWADSVESSIYIAARRPAIRAKLMSWADDQIAYMFKCQRPDGFVSDDYLDGNFIRTAMLYADMRSGGFRLYPWKPDTILGLAASDHDGDSPQGILVIKAGPGGYKGQLLPDHHRYRDHLKLPWDWPRLNSWPEWSGTAAATVGNSQGIPIDLKPNETKVIKLHEINAELWHLP
jgi:hypothetical protein